MSSRRRWDCCRRLRRPKAPAKIAVFDKILSLTGKAETARRAANGAAKRKKSEQYEKKNERRSET